MTGDIPPAMLVDYICTHLDVPFREPKQQRWVKGIIPKANTDNPIAIWHPLALHARSLHRLSRCTLTDKEGRTWVYHFCQDDSGPILWAENLVK